MVHQSSPGPPSAAATHKSTRPTMMRRISAMKVRTSSTEPAHWAHKRQLNREAGDSGGESSPRLRRLRISFCASDNGNKCDIRQKKRDFIRKFVSSILSQCLLKKFTIQKRLTSLLFFCKLYWLVGLSGFWNFYYFFLIWNQKFTGIWKMFLLKMGIIFCIFFI